MRGHTSCNKRYTLRRLFSGSGFRKIPAGLTPFVGFYSTTFLQLLETYGFLNRNCKNVVYLERYAKLQFELIDKIL
jgi:hypothetical protein